MKKFVKITALLLVLTMMLVLGGCGKMTAQTLAAKMAVAAAKRP